MSIKCRAAILVEPNKPLVVDEVELPDPGPDQVLVKLFASGVCHSQLHTMRRPPRPGHRLPALLGHESTGIVVAKGRDVTHVREGDHVITKRDKLSLSFSHVTLCNNFSHLAFFVISYQLTLSDVLETSVETLLETFARTLVARSCTELVCSPLKCA